MAQHTIPKRATNVASTGKKWTDVAKAYDSDTTTYAHRTASGNSACHINGFSFDIPKIATINKVVVDFKVYTSNKYGYFSGHLYTNTGSSISYSIFLNKKAQTTPTYFTLEVSADTIQAKLNSLNVYNKDIFTFLKSGIRVRWVGGGANNTTSSVDCRVYDTKVTVHYTLPDYTITVKAGEGGTVSGGGTFEQGKTTTIKATPNSGYKFVKWLEDGNTSASRTVTVSGNATYTAYFELDKVYVTFDSIFNFNKWKDAGIISGNSATISNITDTGFSITANASDSYTNNSPLYTVTPNTDYILEYDAVGNGHEAFVFCDGKVVAGRFWSTTNGVLRFTVPSDCTTIAIRCDSNISGNTIDYSNIRIYPADYSYMSNSVTAINRSCINSWNFPTPTRTGYDFLGWNTKPDGSGITYNSNSTFPTEDLVLYSQFTIKQYKITTTWNTGGIVTGGGTFDYGSSITLKATPDKNYSFVSWSDEDTTNPRQVTVLGNATYGAIFEPDKVQIVINPNGGIYNNSSSNTVLTKSFGETISILNPLKDSQKFTYWTITDLTSLKIQTAAGYTINGSNTHATLTRTLSTDGSYTNYKWSNLSASSDTWNYIGFNTYSVSANETIKISGYIRINGTSPVGLNFYHGSKENDYQNSKLSLNSTNNEWKRFDITRTFTEASNTAVFQIYTGSIKNIVGEINFDLKEIKIERENGETLPTIIQANGDLTLTANYRDLQMVFKSVKIYRSDSTIASPTNPLKSGDWAQIVVNVSLE